VFIPPPGRLTPAIGDCPRTNECEADALLAEKKCWFCDRLGIVAAAAARPLAEKLSRPGVTGNLPVEKFAFRNVA